MSGRDREEFHVTCHSCFGEVHIDCQARPACPRCGQILDIQWASGAAAYPDSLIETNPAAVPDGA